MSIINSPTNFKVLNWSKLKIKSNRDKQGLFIVEGYHLVNEAFKTGSLKEIITTEKTSEFDVLTSTVTYEVMEKLTSLATPTKFIGICKKPDKKSYGNNILLVDQITHPGNLGTIIRSAVAFNVDTIVLHNSVDVYNQKLIQATQGMIFHINIIKSPINEFITELKKNEYQIIGTDVNEGQDLRNVKTREKRGVLVGSEGEGVSENLLKMCDVKINIKMNKKCESLNVGVATSIILHGLI